MLISLLYSRSSRAYYSLPPWVIWHVSKQIKLGTVLRNSIRECFIKSNALSVRQLLVMAYWFYPTSYKLQHNRTPPSTYKATSKSHVVCNLLIPTWLCNGIVVLLYDSQYSGTAMFWDIIANVLVGCNLTLDWMIFDWINSSKIKYLIKFTNTQGTCLPKDLQFSPVQNSQP